MKKIAYVFVDDFGHPGNTILPTIEKIFDRNEWHVVVMNGIDSIVNVSGAPDLLVNYKLGASAVIDDLPCWYETSPFTYQWMKWVKEGMGLLVIHAGLTFIPADHPVVTEGTYGRFAGHPAIAPLSVKMMRETKHPISEGVDDFDEDEDEHFQIVDLDESRTTVFARSQSAVGGTQPAGWAHEVGKGRVAVLCPGHVTATCQNMLRQENIKLMQNAVNWCSKAT